MSTPSETVTEGLLTGHAVENLEEDKNGTVGDPASSATKCTFGSCWGLTR